MNDAHIDPALTRRQFGRAAIAAAASTLLVACDQKVAPPATASSTAKPPKPSSPTPANPAPAPAPTRTLVAYCSADPDVASPVFAEFTKRTGCRVEPVFDTEATKTTGLVMRLTQEKDRARADVFWSSEPFGVISLARSGVLDDSTSQVAEHEMQAQRPDGASGWPPAMRDQHWLDGKPPAAGPRWYGFASRARVVVYNTKLVSPADAPVAYNQLMSEKFNGRIAMAKPQFGTTRGHMAILADVWGKGPFGEWLADMKRAGVRLYDGNAAVVRAVATGDAHAGLCDSDDVFAGQKEGWPVAMSFIKCPNPRAKLVPRTHPRWAEQQRVARTGTILLPNTVARIRGGQNPKDAQALIDFLLSKETQRTLARSDSHNIPVDPEDAARLSPWLPPKDDIVEIDFDEAADEMEGAMKLCDSMLGG